MKSTGHDSGKHAAPPSGKRFGHYAFEPVWRSKDALVQHRVPAGLQDWLFDPTSLTARLVAMCPGRFRVEVIAQGWKRPMFNEARRLGMKPDQAALVREVYLYCDQRPWVFARTIIPHRTLRGPQRYLAHLGDRPLGSVLFADASMRRDPVEVACIQPVHRLYATATAALLAEPNRDPGDAPIWGRRSVFYTGGKSLLVSEVFLPALLLQSGRASSNNP